MPAQSEWLLLVPAIRGVLEALDLPVLDRAMIERLFQLRRRRAIGLLHRFGGFQTARTFLIERTRLIGALRTIESGRDFYLESRRRQRLSEHLEQAQRQLQAKSAVSARHLAPAPGLGDGVVLQPGALHIEFTGAADLLAKLYRLSQVAAEDYPAFQAASDGAGPRGPAPGVDQFTVAPPL